MTDQPVCATCGQIIAPPVAPAVTVPATHYCPVCGKQYPEDGSCDYGHPNVPQLVPIEPVETAAPAGPTGPVEVPPPAEPVYGAPDQAPVAEVEQPPAASAQGPSQPEPDPNAGKQLDELAVNVEPLAGEPGTESYGRFAADDATGEQPCPTCHGARTVPAPPPAGEVICPTCSGTGKAPDYSTPGA